MQVPVKTMIRSGMGLSMLLDEDTRNSGEKEMAVWSQEKLVIPLSVGCLIRRKDEQVMQALFSVLSDIWDVAEDNYRTGMRVVDPDLQQFI